MTKGETSSDPGGAAAGGDTGSGGTGSGPTGEGSLGDARPRNDRAAGVLLHPTSLPGPFGLGDFGPGAERFLTWAGEAGLRLWQVLPLFPAGAGNSPYSAHSTFAGDPRLISAERLVEDGLLVPGALSDPPAALDDGRVDYPAARAWKEPLLHAAWTRFRDAPPAALSRAFERFHERAAAASGYAAWLEDWLLFTVLRRRFEGRGWIDWPAPLRDRQPAALATAGRELADEIDFERFLQFLFFEQWDRVRQAAGAAGIRLVGDLPIYLAYDSADVWAHRELFDLDGAGRPRAVAGVPPDYFSAEGQLWGNPLYRWDRMAETGFAWWVARVRASLRLTDLLRLDHFRGFVDYWRVPVASAKRRAKTVTAADGAWVQGPGKALFDALAKALAGPRGSLPLLAEDLGDLTPAVHALRDELGLPGMKVLQFAFADDDSEHLPRHHRARDVVYTGTHDNDTSRGWFGEAPEEVRRRALELLPGGAADPITWRMIRAAYGSPAGRAVIPMQDLLGLGSEARMNRPGTAEGNWEWRLSAGALTTELAERLRALAEEAGRLEQHP